MTPIGGLHIAVRVSQSIDQVLDDVIDQEDTRASVTWLGQEHLRV